MRPRADLRIREQGAKPGERARPGSEVVDGAAPMARADPAGSTQTQSRAGIERRGDRCSDLRGARSSAREGHGGGVAQRHDALPICCRRTAKLKPDRSARSEHDLSMAVVHRNPHSRAKNEPLCGGQCGSDRRSASRAVGEADPAHPLARRVGPPTLGEYASASSTSVALRGATGPPERPPRSSPPGAEALDGDPVLPPGHGQYRRLRHLMAPAGSRTRARLTRSPCKPSGW
jgi:hypothetical protein